MKKRIMAAFAAILLIISALPGLAASAQNYVPSDTYVIANGHRISLMIGQTNGRIRLFLPAFADMKTLTAGNDTKDVTLKIKGERLTVDGAGIDVMQGDLPAFFITLDGGNADLLKINHSKSYSASGKGILIAPDGETVWSGGLERVWGHGNTSFQPANSTKIKNSFNLKLTEKAELLEGAENCKKYALISPRFGDERRDISGMSQMTGYYLHDALVSGDDNYDFSVNAGFVDLYVNDDYRGIYILTERANNGGAIDIHEIEDDVECPTETLKKVTKDDPAIDAGIDNFTYSKDAVLKEGADITGGYVLEVKCGSYAGCGFQTKHGLWFEVKSPDYCTKEMVSYIAKYVQEFENALFSPTGLYNGKTIADYADLKSLADQILALGFTVNSEQYRTSTYLYKDTDDSKQPLLGFGPGWDYEDSGGQIGSATTFFDTVFTYTVPQQYVWHERLWQCADFMRILESENARMRTIVEKLYSETLPAIAKTAEASERMNDKRWDRSGSADAAYAYIDAVKKRYVTWYGSIWNPGKYVFGIETAISDNGDGTVTITAKSIGTRSGGFSWYNIDEETGKRTMLRTNDDHVTVPADGALYACTVHGRNNAFCDFTTSKVFSSVGIDMTTLPIAALVPPIEEPDEPLADPDLPEKDAHPKSSKKDTVSAIVLLAASAAALTAAAVFERKKK